MRADPLTGRDDKDDALRRWRDAAGQLSVLWLHGTDAMRRVRMTDRFVAESRALGWQVVSVAHDPGAAVPEKGGQHLRLDQSIEVLLIVDGADRWPLTHLTWLLSNSMLHRSDRSVRVVLLAATLDGWPAIRGALANRMASTAALP